MTVLKHVSNKTKTNDSPLLLIRHGEKENPPPEDMALTEKGILDSRNFGYMLRNEFKAELSSIHTSPLKRCTMTSEKILNEYGYYFDIKQSTILGDPGPFILDSEKARKSFLRASPDSIIQKHFKEKNISGFRTPRDGSSVIINYIMENWSDGLNVLVTHDVIIASLFGYLVGYIPEMKNWIDYLEGLCFYKEGENILVDTPEGLFDISDKVEYLMNL